MGIIFTKSSKVPILKTMYFFKQAYFRTVRWKTQKKRDFAAVILASIFLMNLLIVSQLSVFGQSGDFEFLGFSSYVTTQAELENTIAIMKSKNLNAYRVSFKPSWIVPEGNVRGYNAAYIDHLLSNTNFFIIVDGNHLYPASEQSAQDARNHWMEVKTRIFQILERYPNNQRVAVELINEYSSDDYDTRIQGLIDEIRGLGYTNPIVANKLYTAWQKFSDPLNNTFQGMHFYFNSWDASKAISQMNIALSRGITKIFNTEVGASSNEYKYYTQANVDELESFLSQSQALGVNSCIWMNNDTVNWQGYTQYNFTFNTPVAPTPSPSPSPEPTATPTPTPSPTPIPTATPTPTLPTPSPTPKPTPTLSPTPSPTPVPTLFADSFESKSFNRWSGKGGTGTHFETIETRNPQDGSYNAKFYAGSKSESWAYKNLPASPIIYFQQNIKLQSLPTSGNRLYLGTIQSDSRNTMEVFIQNSWGRNYWGVCTTINGRQYYDREITSSNPKTGTYYSVEMCRDAKSSQSKLWVDGTLKIDADRSHLGYSNRVYSGISWTNTRAVVYVDNVKVSSTYTGLDTNYTNTTEVKSGLKQYLPSIYSGSLIFFL